jgi:2-keto-4-pentenoate hydratase/2-oxohepta-3-ene-1,7-dioic acid hydratase in catechol pathway
VQIACRPVRLVTYISSSGARAGLLTDEGVIDAAAALGEGGGMSARGVLEADRMADLEAARGEPLADPELLPPVPDPDKIVCIGLNYRSHAEEAGQEPPESPTFFAKFRNALAAPGATVALPQASDKVDYEAEVAMVIGRRAREVSEADALEHVAGYTLFNDLSARDLQFATPQWMPGKASTDRRPAARPSSPRTKPARRTRSRSRWS